MANGLGLNHVSSLYPCAWCLCNTLSPEHEHGAVWDDTPKPWRDFTAGALWRETIWACMLRWFRSVSDGVHDLWWLPGLSLANLFADPMHTLDLGVNHYFLGSILWLLCFTDKYVEGATPAQRCEDVWGRIARQYAGRGTTSQLSTLELKFFVSDIKAPRQGRVCMSSRVKAAECRHLVPIVLMIWEDVMDHASLFDTHVLLALRAMTTIYQQIDECDTYRFTDAALAKWQAAIDEFISNYDILNTAVQANDPHLFHFTIKLHVVEHLKAQAEVQSPQWSWCYMDEDFMQVCKKLYNSCACGTPTQRVVMAMLLKWEAGFLLRSIFAQRGD